MSDQNSQSNGKSKALSPPDPHVGSVFRSALRFILSGEPHQGSASSHSSLSPTSSDTPRAVRCAVLVIDASPSMEDTDWPPSRLRAAQEAACAYVDQVAQDDPDALIAVVAFHKSARIYSPLMSVGRNRAILRAAIDGITTSSATNITAGLESAYRLLNRRSGRFNQVLLLTDGEHNYGGSPLSVADRVRQCATVECVGIGGHPSDVNEDLLKSIASAFPDGSKRYRWIGDKARLVEHFRQVAGRLTRS